MTFFLRSKYVRRVGSDQVSLVNGTGNQEKDNFDDIILSSNTSDLPAKSNKTAECLGIQRGHFVCREKVPLSPVKNKKAEKRSYQYSAVEDEVPFIPFKQLPHPRDLFGKRTKADKKEKFKTSPVDSHKMQLHKKLAQHDLIKEEFLCITGNDHDDAGIQVHNTSCNSHLPDTNNNHIVNSSLSKGTCFQSPEYGNDTSKLLGCSLYEFPCTNSPSSAASILSEPINKADTLKTDFLFPSDFCHTKPFEE